MKAKEIALADIRPSEHNTHLRSRRGDAAFDGLVGSMEAIGLVQRITVRKMGDAYEIIDGHRRYEAATELGWDRIPADVTDDADDHAQAKTLAANVQRLDNDPIAEANLIEEMRGRGMTLDAIAAMIGKSESYVARRNRLASLTAEWRDYGREEEITAATLERIAAYEPELQRRVWTECADKGDKPYFVAEDEILNAFEARLRAINGKCPFSTKECAGCPNNTATQRFLFADMQKDHDSPMCQDPVCYAKKWNEAIEKKAAKLRKDKTIEVKTVKRKWDIPLYYCATERRDKDSAVAYVTEEELPRIWYAPKRSQPEADKPAKSPEERKREKEAREWRRNRSTACGKIGRLIDADIDSVLAAMRNTKAYSEYADGAVRSRISQTWNDESRLDVYGLLGVQGLHDLGCDELTPEEVKALNSEDPRSTGTDTDTGNENGNEEE